ncbi:hypothetical protein [Micropruina sp.]|uniref:hypothetical protein n=1 Tax=Micropruina sp. TaxID=2737536 RepID=UPI0039E67C78
MQLVAWVALCLATAWWFRRRPVLLACLVFWLWTLVPSVAGHHLTGLSVLSPLGFHPASWLALAGVLAQMIWDPGHLGRVIGSHPYLSTMLVLFIVMGGATSYYNGSGGSRLLIDQIVAPVALGLMVISRADRRGQLLLRDTVLLATAVQAVLSLMQSALGSIIFYEDDYLTNSWFSLDRFVRWMGTTESPLILSLLLSSGAALTLGLRSNVFRFGLLLLYCSSTLVTQSRVGGVMMLGVLVLAVFRSRISIWTRLLTSAGLVGASIWIAATGLAGGLLSRLQDDTGSSQAREQALQFVLENWHKYLFSGAGLTSSYDIAREAGLQTSVESSFLMYAIDVGLVLAVLFFGGQVLLLALYGRHGWISGIALGATLVLVLQNASSALAFANLTGTLTWVLLGLVIAGARTGPPPDQRAGAPAAARPLASASS